MSLQYETNYVHNVYARISNHFSSTRVSFWKQVAIFLDSFTPYSILFDAGCGNGKYMKYRKDLLFTGMDACSELLTYAKNKADVFQGNVINIPCKTGIYHGIISIAVLHHISTRDKRIQFINELVRILEVNGKGLISVWALEQENPKYFEKWQHMGNNDYLIPWNNTGDGKVYQRYYHLFSKNEIETLFNEIKGIDIISVQYEKSNWFVEFIKSV